MVFLSILVASIYIIKLRRSCDCLFPLSFGYFGSVLSPNYAIMQINTLVNIKKVYIERNNWQLELIRYRKNVDFIHVYFCEATDSMQYHPPTAYISGRFEHKPT